LLDTGPAKARLGDANVGRVQNDEAKWVRAIPQCFGLLGIFELRMEMTITCLYL
jgi:hypothetical protein